MADWIHKASRHRFSRIRGRPLTEWLLDLVSGERDKQLACAEMLDGLRSHWLAAGESDGGIEDHWRRIDRAVRASVSRRKFPRRDFVRRLVTGYEACLRHQQGLAQRELDRPSQAAKHGGLDSMRLFLAHGWVFDALGPELLEAEDLLRPQIGGLLSHQVAGWLTRLGPEGRLFLPEALSLLDSGGVYWHPWTPALAAIVGDDVDALTALAQRLDASDFEPPPPHVPGSPGREPSIASRRIDGTLQTLALVGAPARQVPGILERLEALVEPFAPYAVEALGSVGADDGAVLRKLIRYSEHQAWSVRAGAILGLAHFPSHAESVVPRLCELLRTYEEMDADWMYAGDHERVLSSLGAYKAAALSAIDVLDELGYFDLRKHRGAEQQKSFFLFLGDLGTPAAERALAPLEALVAAIYAGDEDGLAEDLPDASRDDMPMLWALRRLRGEI